MSRDMTHEEAAVILAVAAIHLFWGVLLIFSPAARGATPLAGLSDRLPLGYALGAVLVLAALTAAGAVYVGPTTSGLLLLLPQQSLLVVSVWSCVAAVVGGTYADLTVVPGGWQHVGADQAAMIAWGFTHAYVYWRLYLRAEGD